MMHAASVHAYLCPTAHLQIKCIAHQFVCRTLARFSRPLFPPSFPLQATVKYKGVFASSSTRVGAPAPKKAAPAAAPVAAPAAAATPGSGVGGPGNLAVPSVPATASPTSPGSEGIGTTSPGAWEQLRTAVRCRQRSGYLVVFPATAVAVVSFCVPLCAFACALCVVCSSDGRLLLGVPAACTTCQ